MTQIGVKTRRIRNLYVLVVFAPRSRTTVFQRVVSRRPQVAPKIGEVLQIGQVALFVRAVAQRVEHGERAVEHVTEVFTSARATVTKMPLGPRSVVAEFLRYHVLVRVFDGDPDAWLAELLARGGDDGDLRFVHWIRSRLRQDPALILSIRRMVDATPFWGARKVM